MEKVHNDVFFLYKKKNSILFLAKIKRKNHVIY